MSAGTCEGGKRALIKNEILTRRDEILAELSNGWSVRAIWEVLSENKEITCTYKTFAGHIRRLQAERSASVVTPKKEVKDFVWDSKTLNERAEKFRQQLQKELGLTVGPKDPILAEWLAQEEFREELAAELQRMLVAFEAALMKSQASWSESAKSLANQSLNAALRVRSLHMTVLRRLVEEPTTRLPDSDPAHDATVLASEVYCER